MCGHYLALAETAEPLLRTRAQLRWFDVLAAESSNMHATLRWAVERGDSGTALRFGAALTWYWYLCGQCGDYASLVKAALALDAAGSGRADRARAEARAICAGAVSIGANWDMEVGREALAAAVADPSGRPPHPSVMIGRALVARFGDDPARGLELLAGYLDAADPWTGATARLESAVILLGLGRIEEASLGCDAALAAFRETGEIWGTGMALMLRAELDKIAGNYRGAIAALEEAAAPGRQLGSAPDRDITWLYSDLARLQVRAGDYAAAHAVLDRADHNARERGDPGRYLRLIRAELAWREGHPADAARLCEDILLEGAAQPASQAPLRALAGARLGILKIEAGDIAAGTTLLRDALAVAAAAGDRPAAAATVEGLAAAALQTGAAERAATLLGSAESIRGAADHSSLDAPGIRAAAREHLGEAAFDAACRRGLGMSYDEALGFAQG
jgi:tetratricopeptide (TPR) repeat protein